MVERMGRLEKNSLDREPIGTRFCQLTLPLPGFGRLVSLTGLSPMSGTLPRPEVVQAVCPPENPPTSQMLMAARAEPAVSSEPAQPAMAVVVSTLGAARLGGAPGLNPVLLGDQEGMTQRDPASATLGAPDVINVLHSMALRADECC